MLLQHVNYITLLIRLHSDDSTQIGIAKLEVDCGYNAWIPAGYFPFQATRRQEFRGGVYSY